VTRKIQVLWYVMPCRLVNTDLCMNFLLPSSG